MKYLFTAIISIAFVVTIKAQDAPPEFINYSSVIRGNNGQALPNKGISFRFSIRELSETGNISYQEIQNTTTSQVGSVSIKIGSGQSQSGQFSDIKWGIGSHYLQIELDDEGGNNFSNMGTVMLVSVPYALYAKNASVADSAAVYSEEDPLFSASVASGITETDTTKWNNIDLAETDPLFNESIARSITANDTAKWSSAIQVESDPVFNASVAVGITEVDTIRWNNREFQEADPLFEISLASGITEADTSKWNNKLESFTESDPLFSSSIHDLATKDYVDSILLIAGISVQADVTNVDCFGDQTGAIDVTVVGGTGNYSYSWSNGSTSEDLVNVSSGEYNLLVVDENNEFVRRGYIIRENSQIIIEGELQKSSGSDGGIDLRVTGGVSPFSYSWDTGQNTEDISGLNQGTYQVTVTDSLGCQSSASYHIENIIELNESIVNISCAWENNGSIALSPSGGTEPYSYSWSDGATTPSRTNLGPGSYSVLVTDLNGSSVEKSFEITQPNELYISYDLTHAANYDGMIDVTVSGGTAPYTYSWDDGINTEDRLDLIPGNYNLTVTDSNGCSKSLSGEILFSLKINISNNLNEAVSGSNVIAFDHATETNIQGYEITSGYYEILSSLERNITLLIANPNYKGIIEENIANTGIINTTLTDDTYGSVMAYSGTCYIPGLSGRLNPIKDSSDRLYLYADNISINDGLQQPVTFNLVDPLKLEDAYGVIKDVWIPFAEGDTFLLNYQPK